MKIISKIESVVRWQVTCPECKSVLEGDPDTEFKTKTSIDSSWKEFFCPVCEEIRTISWYSVNDELKKFRRVRYAYNPKTKELGERIS